MSYLLAPRVQVETVITAKPNSINIDDHISTVVVQQQDNVSLN
jgi:hypothetical protein